MRTLILAAGGYLPKKNMEPRETDALVFNNLLDLPEGRCSAVRVSSDYPYSHLSMMIGNASTVVLTAYLPEPL